MTINRYFKIVLASIGVALCLIYFNLWLLPEKAMAENVDIENRLSYISKVVGAIESSVIKMEGDLRFVKRQMDISILSRDSSKKRLNALETKINTMKSLVDSIAMDVDEMDGNIAYIERDMDDLASGSCDNIFLCKQK